MRRPVVVGHVRPDADCIGSMCAVALTWTGDADGGVSISLPAGSLSRRLAFLSDWANVRIADTADFEAADGFVAVDTAKKPRCNVDKALGEDWSTDRPVVNVDHHDSNTQFGSVNWVDADAGSASELVYRLIRAAGRPISPVVASLLYAGIHSDTMGFSLQTTAASALHAAADLVDSGARVAEIGARLCRSQSQSEFELNRIIYANTKVVADGRIAYSSASYDEIMGSGCTAADIDDQVSIPQSVEGIQLAILLTEGARGKTRMNFRGEADVDVLSLAVRLGGGGHNQAAGAILSGSIEQAVERVLPMAMELLDDHAKDS
jgi:bifunctional oligoribonuclease and PAP phosphatase NrnA